MCGNPSFWLQLAVCLAGGPQPPATWSLGEGICQTTEPAKHVCKGIGKLEPSNGAFSIQNLRTKDRCRIAFLMAGLLTQKSQT